jgi:hypothetical protein
MTRKCSDPEAPEVLEAVIERMRRMTRDEWVQELVWHPKGAAETWRTGPVLGRTLPEGMSLQTVEPVPDEMSTPCAELVAVPGKSRRP